MPYVPCKETWCDHPESCQQDHWVPGPNKTCPHCAVVYFASKVDAHAATCKHNPMSEEQMQWFLDQNIEAYDGSAGNP